MGRVRVCVGSYAKNPYMIGQSDVRVYSLEELCYYLCRHAVMIDGETFTQELPGWVEGELHLPELAESLRTMQRDHDPVESLARRILEECHYCSRERLEEVTETIRRNAGLDLGEKKKRRIDHLAGSGRHRQALLEYMKLLAAVEGKDIALTASVYNAMGCIEAKMFYFALAEEHFEKAYRLTYRKDSLRHYVCAVRMHGTRQEQELKLAASPEMKALAAEVDEQIAAYRAQFRETDACERVRELAGQWENGAHSEYYVQVEETMSQLKEAYRKQCE